MRLINYLFENLELSSFDNKFMKTIKNYERMYLREKEGTYYTIIDNNKKIGVIGFNTNKDSKPFLQIAIHQDYRNKGYFEKSIKMLVKKHKFKRLFSDISKNNQVAIEAHEKMGFNKMTDDIDIDKRLFNVDMRMYKDF